MNELTRETYHAASTASQSTIWATQIQPLLDVERRCAVCRKDITHLRVDAKFCGESCRSIAWVRKNSGRS
jgi:predicted nucleic acid-binding Zn ribbon protein